jgi:2-C-methyl-D-erythritol 2,4-cyclodiphosphate synthase
MSFRVGFGYDAHRLVENRKLILGGVEIPYHLGCLAHSDGDALIHAIIDALFGAAGLADIGTYFPDNTSEFEGIDSTILLKKTRDIITQKGYEIGNIDCTVLLEKPKLKDFIPSMKRKLAEVLEIHESQLGIKAGTNEGMGFVGSGEGVAVYAVALITDKIAQAPI